MNDDKVQQVKDAAEHLKEAAATTEDIVNTILKKAIDGATQGAEFLKDQVPDVVQQLLRWKFWEATLLATLETSAIIFIVCCFVYCFKRGFGSKCNDPGVDDDVFCPLTILVGIFGGAIAGMCVIGCVQNITTAVEVSIAPKVWLLEYAAHLMHK